MKSTIETDDLRTFSGKQDWARSNGPTIYHQAVRALKVLAGMVGNQDRVSLLAARAKAHVNPLNSGTANLPAFSARFQTEHPAAWWNKPTPVFVRLPEKEIKPVISIHKQTVKPPTGEKL